MFFIRNAPPAGTAQGWPGGPRRGIPHYLSGMTTFCWRGCHSSKMPCLLPHSGELGDRQDQPHQVCLPEDVQLVADLPQAPIDGGFRALRRCGNLAHRPAFRQPDRYLALHLCEAQARGHRDGVNAGLTPQLGNQHQDGDVASPEVRLAGTYGLNVHDERRQRGGATE